MAGCAAAILAAGYCSLDVETTSLNWWNPIERVTHAAISVDGKVWVFQAEGLEWEGVKHLFYTVINRPETAVIAHNGKFDLHWFGDVEIRCKVIDTMVALFLLDENQQNGLKSSVKRIFGHEMLEFKEMLGTVTEELPDARTKKGTRKRTRPRKITEVPFNEVAPYVADDAFWTERTWFDYCAPKIDADPYLSANFYNIQMPLLKVLLAMECRGVEIDEFEAKKLRESYEKELKGIDGRIAEIIPEIEVNLGSPAQLDELFYQTLHYKRPPFRPSSKDDEGKKERASTRQTSSVLSG